MKCVSKSVTFAVVAACLALAVIGSSGVQQVEARAFRHDVHVQHSQPATAEHVLMRERYYTKKHHHGVQGDEPDEEMVPEVPGVPATSDYESVVHKILAAVMRVFGSSPSDDTAKDFVIPDEVKLQAPVKTPMAATEKRSNGKLCIAGMCGLNLFFASLWITFAACFLVVYLLDRQLHRKKSLHDASSKNSKKNEDEKTESKPVTRAPVAVVKRSAVTTTTSSSSTSHKRSMNGIRARMRNYYQDVTDMSASILHRRPPLGI